VTRYGKLVRDRVPEVLRRAGVEPVTHVADDSEYFDRLIDKLREETGELAAHATAEELADVLEVVSALSEALGLSDEEMARARSDKARERGRFSKRIVLERTDTDVERVRSYDYARRVGLRPVSWDEFGALTVRLAESLAPAGIEGVVGVARAGLLPAVAVAAALRCNLHPVQLTRRENDLVVRDAPEWKVRVSPAVAGRVVAVVDDVADSGQTLSMVAAEAMKAGAREWLPLRSPLIRGPTRRRISPGSSATS
jgi:predicted house-cleaning noncanonical NTP pyrophosphatase (MazG superfamily)